MPSSIRNDTSTVVAKRDSSAPVDTDEIRALATAAECSVVAERTQVGPEDVGTHFGRGKVDELAAVVEETDATLVVVDGELTPSQHRSIETHLPPETRVFDRYRLVLEIFASRAGTRRAQLQVELARLKYDLPRLVESADEGMLNRAIEKGSPVYDVRDRIDRLERKLEETPDPAEQFREHRREEGFDLVTITGYTNAGKSTLLHRLADDLELEAEPELECGSTAEFESVSESDIGDERQPSSDVSSNKNATASIRDRLFETLETTTRRATIDGRPVLATDTVGFVSDLPHWLVASFSETLSEARAADAVVLVADASDPCDEFREKLDLALDVLAEQGVDRDDVVTACNKVDLLAENALEARLDVAAEVAPTPIPVSVRARTNLEAVRTAIRARLPTERADLRLRNCDEAMALVSRAYDRTSVETVDYDGSTVRLVCDGPPSVLERLRAQAEPLEVETDT